MQSMQVKKDSKKELKLLISEKESLKQSSALKRQITKSVTKLIGNSEPKKDEVFKGRLNR